MKLTLLAVSLAIFSSSAFSTSLVVGTYNIEAKVMGDHRAQKDLMLNNHVEIFGLQEINYKNERFADKKVHKYNPIDQFVGNDYKYFYYGNAVNFSQGGYGIATISSLPLQDEETVNLVLNALSDKHRSEFERLYQEYNPTDKKTVNAMNAMWDKNGIVTQGVMEPRVYTRVVVEKEGQKIAFYNTHLSFESQAYRKKQMQQIMQAMTNDPIKYQVLVGDFNADQSTKEWDIWREKFTIANGADHIWYDTFIDEDPDMKVNSIDNIIVSKNIKIKSIKRIDSSLSDHVPLIANIELQ